MIFFVLLIALPVLAPLDLLHEVAIFTEPLHALCLKNVPSSQASEIIAALSCGENLHSENWREFFTRAGLYHLVVISKAHYTFLCSFLTWILARQKNIFSRLTLVTASLLYACACGLQAPLVRTLVVLSLYFFATRYRMAWSRTFILMISALLCLTLHPLWLDSLSLLHSLACALAFIAADEFRLTGAKAYVFAYLMTLPFLWGWTSVHPLGLVVNALAAPLLFATWFPLSLLACLFHPLAFLVSDYILGCIHALNLLLDAVPPQETSKHLPTWLLWSLFFSLALFLRFRKKWEYHRQGPSLP